MTRQPAVGIAALCVGLSLLVVQGTRPSAQTSRPAHSWTPDQLARRGPLGSPDGNYSSGNVRRTVVSRRDRSGNVEAHATMTDVLVVQRGEATLLLGGEILDPTEIRPGELTGASIRGATTTRLTPGSIAYIPAGVPHQMMLEPGTEITYFVMKVADTP